MKTLFLSLISLMMLLFFSCAKEDGLLSDSSSQADLLKSSHHDGKVFKVTPSGVDDTQALLDAFEDAKASGPGSVVQLVKGTYTIGMIEVRDFDGFFRGAGKGKTILSNLCCLPCEAAWEANVMPALLKFVNGNIIMSDMTIHLNDGEPCTRGPLNESMYGDLACILVLADYSATYFPVQRQIKGEVNNVDFIAGDDDGYGTYKTESNAGMAIYCGSDLMWFEPGTMPLSTGEITVRNCYFDNDLCGPDFWAFDENSIIHVENNTMSGGLQQVFMGSLMGSEVTVINNKFLNGMFVDLYIDGSDFGYYTGRLPARSGHLTIKGNMFHSPQGVVSMYITDKFRINDPASPPQLYNVFDNTFSTQDGELSTYLPWGTFGVVEGVMAIQALDLKNAAIWNNKFLGTGTAGIYIDGLEDEFTGNYNYAENFSVTGNLFNAKYETASVYLGPLTKNCNVVVMKNDEVMDDGTDNSIIGVKAHKGGNHHGQPHSSAIRTGIPNAMPGRPLPAHK
jgi:hypothetical protein